MPTFRNRYHEPLSVGWNGYLQTIEPDETIEVSDEIADDPNSTIEGDRWVRVDSPKTARAAKPN